MLHRATKEETTLGTHSDVGSSQFHFMLNVDSATHKVNRILTTFPQQLRVLKHGPQVLHCFGPVATTL